jgi:uncharacterized protein (DUF4415 family)
MRKTTLKPDQLDRLHKLAELSDEDIDLSDIPEIPASATLYRPLKQPVTIRLDADVVNWFKAQAGDRPYQTEINRVLREHVSGAQKRRA